MLLVLLALLVLVLLVLLAVRVFDLLSVVVGPGDRQVPATTRPGRPSDLDGR
ncbi:hypothetical protein [Streptomyces lycii]|uniref:Uncharacterized protein n=1 Tax=Streptomyces lycii TaxID=2654337 RepID=A0ABQ7FBZ8_9ACTN|nr:hypothetical protein [Streptomyces lycii]KAF4405351.1 hypothetical protein GCU69_30780 [Streptomyces lycii]